MSNFIINAELRIEAECLCDENEQLKDENEHMWLKAFAIIGELLEENVKLRELCADLRFCKRNNCLTCSHGRFCNMHFDERFAELGVEVD